MRHAVLNVLKLDTTSTVVKSERSPGTIDGLAPAVRPNGHTVAIGPANPVGSGHEARNPKWIRFMTGIDKRGKPGRHTWRVKWRVGGTRDGRGDGEICDDLMTCGPCPMR